MRNEGYIEGLHSSLASAISGKTLLWGIRVDENRLGKVIVHVEIFMEMIRDWYLTEYYVGGELGLDVPQRL